MQQNKPVFPPASGIEFSVPAGLGIPRVSPYFFRIREIYHSNLATSQGDKNNGFHLPPFWASRRAARMRCFGVAWVYLTSCPSFTSTGLAPCVARTKTR